MIDAGSAIGANLGSVFDTDEEWLGAVIWALEFGEVFCDEFGVVEATSTDVMINGGEGDDDGWGV